MSGKGAIIALIFLSMALIGSVWGISNGLKDIEEAEKWMAYEHGVCVYVDHLSQEYCNNLSDGNGQTMFNKYYGKNGIFVYGENPKLGYEIQPR